MRWSEDAGTETGGSEREDKRGEVLILSASWGGNSSQLCSSEIGAKEKVEGWRRKWWEESSTQALAPLVPQCAEIRVKNSEMCMLMNNECSQQWSAQTHHNWAVGCVRAAEPSDFEMAIKEAEMRLIYARENKTSNQNILPPNRPSEQPKPIRCQPEMEVNCLNHQQNDIN